MVVAVSLHQAPLFITARKFPSSDLSPISSYKPTTKPLVQTAHDDGESLLNFYLNLFDGHFVSNRFTFLFDACHKISTIREGRQIHGHAIITGLDVNVYAQRALVRMYAKFGECDHASWVLARCSEADIISQNELIAGYIRIGELEAARQVFEEMVERNVVSWSIMVDGYCKNDQIEIAQSLFDEMPERNQFSWNSLITGYLKCGNVQVAETLFDRMPEKNVVAWTTMISGYTKNSLFKEALERFFEMQDSSVKPNRITLISVLPAISELGALTQGRWIHSYVERQGIRLDGALGSALIDMYCKCGCIDEAIAVFEKLKHKGLSAWNSIILGLAAHGRGRDALHIFSRMQKYSSVTPNEITFTCVLSACSHAGLVDEGWKMFNLFTKFYKLAPNVRHYGCMVDLLSRAGLLEEAMELIEKMPMKPNLVIWKTLLGACRIHKNVELAKHISKVAIGSGSRDSGFYALLSNVFSEAEHWDDMGKVRQEMNDLDVRKVAGCSWVEVDGVVHEFFSGGEGFHARGKEIQYVADNLERLITDQGGNLWNSF